MTPLSTRCPISVLIPTRNEERNLGRCLEAVGNWADEIVLVDSQSTDRTLDIASGYPVHVLQFYYKGGWPKKRNWALETHPWRNEWVLLLDADEVLLEPARAEIGRAIRREEYDGYFLRYQIHFLGRRLRFGGTQLYKMALFRRGRGRYEKRLEQQDSSMGDMEIHEHVVVDGRVGKLRSPVQHENFNSLDRYIAKHNEYSNWEAAVMLDGVQRELPPSLWGTQAQRRRWLKRAFLRLPGSPAAFFALRYLLLCGCLDGTPGLIYAVMQATYLFEVKAKAYELRQQRRLSAKAENGGTSG
jgi:glycosyltransferase involved in cell wall biosynthesis